MAVQKFSGLTASVSIDATNDYWPIVQSGANKKINRNVALGLSSAPLGLTDVQAPTNKTFDNTSSFTTKDGSLTLQNTADTTKQAVLSLASITTGNTRTITLPDANLTMVGTATTQTLTNKTLTSPTITGGTIDNSTITVDSISGHSVATTVTVANLQIASGVLNSANAVTATSIANGAIQPQALVAGTGSGWAWSSWTPTFANLTVGNGTLVCKYIQIGKTVTARISFALGTTSSVGTAPTFTLPVTSVSGYVAGHWLGGLRIVAGAAGFTGYIQWATTTTALLLALNASATYVSDTSANWTSLIPGTWTTADHFDGTITYEAA
jgi:hypothetical protein